MKKLLAVLGLAIASLCSCAPVMAQSVNLNNVIRYGASYKSSTLMAANTPDTVFAPGSNVNGAIVWDSAAITGCASFSLGAYVAKSSAPASNIDGDVINITATQGASGSYSMVAHQTEPIYIAAGKGLYYITNCAETSSALRMVLYTLL